MENMLKPVQEDFLDYYCDISENLLCRVCLGRSEPHEKLFSVFEEHQYKNLHISTMIMSFASIQLIEGDGLPATICQKCVDDLNKVWQFKLLCESSDAKLRQYYNNAHNLQVAPDLGDYNVNLKQDQDTNLFLMKSVVDSSAFTIDSIALPVEENDVLENKKEKVASNKEVEVKTPKKTTRQKLEKLKDQKIHQCDTCGKIFNRREYLTQHIRIHTGEKPYHCHLCEKKFVNSGHLTTHMRTHTGERPHSCNLCPKAFSTRQELQKHTMVHNGERPFVCKMCGKRFGSSSNLYSHLKHHTGEKNFKCDHCGKAFYTKQELKQHLVVHTGEKAFLCELCNKRFSQIAHLRRHSKLHKNDTFITAMQDCKKVSSIHDL